MSTRVEKGAPKFKPILKSKARPSAAPDARPSVEPHASMPPPSTIPERMPSVAPAAPTPSPSTTGVQVQSSRAAPVVVPRSSAVISVPSTKPIPISATLIQPSRATPISVQPSALPRAPIPPPSRGVPITLSRSTPAPAATPAPSAAAKGKKRAVPDTTDPETTEDETSAPSTRARGGIGRKRPKLSIVQASEDRVKHQPPRQTKAKRKAAASEDELEAETPGETSDAEHSKKTRASRKKKLAPTDENTAESAAEGFATPKGTRAKPKRKQTQDTDDAHDPTHTGDSRSESEAPPTKKKQRRAPKPPTPEGTPEPIDPTQVTMGTICDDTGLGRVSSRWESSQTAHADARKRAREERARAIAQAAEEERETGRSVAKRSTPRPALPGEGAGEECVVANDNANANADEFTYTEELRASHYAPQVRIGANGEVVLDTESLQVDRAADPEIAEEAYSFVEESDQSRFTNSNSWSKRRSVRWGKEDTALFYDALRQFGQNFDLMARVLPGRTYRMCRNKFKAEDKKNPGLIDDALNNRVAVDLKTLARMTGKDFSGPTPIIEARKALDLREDDAAEHAAPDPDAEAAEGSARKESQTPGAIGDNSDTRPPPAESLPSPIATARESASPPPAESLLRTTTARAGPVAISAPNRPDTRPPAQPATPVSAKKKSKKKAAQEEGVEVLGLVEDHLED